MRYVVLGASAAGVNGVRQLRKRCPEAEIVLVSKDQEIYSRCILHHLIGNLRTREQLCFAEADFAKRYRVDWRKGVACTGVDTGKKEAVLSDGTALSYDKLLIATGSHTFLPPVKGLREAGGVYGFRDMEETEAILEAAKDAKHIVIMGGGLTGLDAATGFLHMGRSVELVELADRLLVKQLDERAASVYQKALEAKGVKLHLGCALEEVRCGDDGQVVSLALSDGGQIPCDLLVVTAGVRSNVEFLEGSGLELDSYGLVIDPQGRTNVADVYGAGDVTGRSPIWPAAVKQGMVAADNMAGIETGMEDFFASKSTMNFLDIPTMSLGLPEKPDDTYEEIVEDTGDQYRKVIHKDGMIYGAILQGDLAYGGVLTQLIARKIDVSRVKKPLFSIDYSDFFHTGDNFEFYYEVT